MKILHIIFSFNTGGAETMLVDILNEQVKTESVSLCIINDSYQQYMLDNIDERADIIKLHRKPHGRGLIEILKLNLLILKGKYDVVHIHNASISRLLFCGPCPFYTVHDLFIPSTTFRRMKCLVAISDAVKEDVLKKGEFPVVVIPNGISCESIQQKTQWEKQSCFRIVQVARLDMGKKGQDILIPAVALLKKQGIMNIHVDFIGEGPSLNSLKKMVEDCDLIANVNFLGLKDRKYIYSHLKEYDLMCHPSRYEGFGLTVAEGMSAKIPVLVPNSDGPFEIIEQGKYGYTFEKGNVDDLAKQIRYLYEHYDECCNIVEDAYDHVVECFSVENMVRKYFELYKREK